MDRGGGELDRACEAAGTSGRATFRQAAWPPPATTALTQALLRHCAAEAPGPADLEVRNRLLAHLNDAIRGWPGQTPGALQLVPFGSFTAGLWTRRSDMDLSLQGAVVLPRGTRTTCEDATQRVKADLLRELAQWVRGRGAQHFSDLELVLKARIPIIKFRDRASGIHIDVSVGNSAGVFKSAALGLLNQLDPRFRLLCLVLKAWARSRNINDPQGHTLNSFSLALLAVFHLQRQDPPILPPLRDILTLDPQKAQAINPDEYPEFRGPVLPDIAAATQRAREFAAARNARQPNAASLAELVATFFLEMAGVGEGLWQAGACASTWAGLWRTRPWQATHPQRMAVEDPFDGDENCAEEAPHPTLAEAWSPL